MRQNNQKVKMPDLTVGELRKAIENVPDEEMIIIQVEEKLRAAKGCEEIALPTRTEYYTTEFGNIYPLRSSLVVVLKIY